MTDFNTRVLTTVIEAEDAGKRIDNWLTARFTYHSRNQWQAMIKQGILTLNDKSTKSSRKLQTGDTVHFALTKEEPPVSFDYTIEYEDDDILLVNKCGNLPCHPAGPFYMNTLWHHLTLSYGDIFMVNRLDRETSGIIIIAKNKAAASNLSKQVEAHAIEKKYYAIVHGIMTGEIDADGYLIQDASSEVRKKRSFIMDTKFSGENGEKSRTLVKALAMRNELTLVECTLKTGRLHQIRATLFSLGFPMVGDKLYGLDDTMYLRLPGDQLTDRDWELLKISRQALHSYYIRFTHPTSGKQTELKLGLPTELNQLFPDTVKPTHC